MYKSIITSTWVYRSAARVLYISSAGIAVVRCIHVHRRAGSGAQRGAATTRGAHACQFRIQAGAGWSEREAHEPRWRWHFGDLRHKA